MTLPVSVQKLKTETFRVLWNTNSNSIKGGYRQGFSSFNYVSKVDLTSLGINECYEIECSMNGVNNQGHYIPSLKLTPVTSDENNFQQRKLTATFLGCEKEMLFISLSNSWTAQWPEMTKIGCPHCYAKLGKTETFEILIEMDSRSSLKQGQKNVLSHIANLWENKTLADVTFKCGNREIQAHTLIVSSGSPVLAAMFQNNFKEKEERVAIIRETTANVFEKLLYFIYTGDFDCEFHDIAGLLIAADMYNVASLKEECDSYMSKNVTLAEATKYLILSHLHNAKKLYEATLNYMQKNSEAICARQDWMALFMTYPKLGFVAMQFMVKKNEHQGNNEVVNTSQPTHHQTKFNAYYDDYTANY